MTDLIEAGAVLPEGWVDIRMSETAWEPQGVMPFDQWEEASRNLQRIGRAWQWWLGDLIRYGENHYPDRYRQATEFTGLEDGTLYNIVMVCKSVPISRRRENLPFSLHQEVAPLAPAEQEEWLSRADTEGMTRERLRTALRQVKRVALPPDKEPAQTYVATFTVVYGADDGPAAEAKARDLVTKLERNGVSVTHKQIRERAR